MRNGMWYILCRYALWDDVIAGPFLTKEAANKHHFGMMRSLAEESVIRQCDIGEQLPKELFDWASSYAYQRGHAYGKEEVDLILEEIVDGLSVALEKYTKRKNVEDNDD